MVFVDFVNSFVDWVMFEAGKKLIENKMKTKERKKRFLIHIFFSSDYISIFMNLLLHFVGYAELEEYILNGPKRVGGWAEE